MNKASLTEKFSLIHEHWRPKVVAELNSQELKLVKFAGVVWVLGLGTGFMVFGLPYPVSKEFGGGIVYRAWTGPLR